MVNNEEGFNLNNYRSINLKSIEESYFSSLYLSAYYSELSFNNSTNSFSLSFDVETEIINTIYKGNNLGLILNFAEDTGGIGKGTSPADGFVKGVWVRNIDGENPIIVIGDFDEDNPGNLTQLTVDDSNNIIKTAYNNEDAGINLNYSNKVYGFGQITGGSGTKLEIDDDNEKLILSANLETTNAGSGAAGKRLKITIGGSDYLIDLITP